MDVISNNEPTNQNMTNVNHLDGNGRVSYMMKSVTVKGFPKEEPLESDE